jgi:hypothetical protein
MAIFALHPQPKPIPVFSLIVLKSLIRVLVSSKPEQVIPILLIPEGRYQWKSLDVITNVQTAGGSSSPLGNSHTRNQNVKKKTTLRSAALKATDEIVVIPLLLIISL